MSATARTNTTLKGRHVGARRSSGTSAGVPRDNINVQAGKRRVIRSSGRTDDQRAASEPNASRTDRNSAGSTGKRTAPKLCIGSAVLGRSCITQRTLPSGMLVTPTLTE